MPIDPSIPLMIRPFQGVNLESIQEGKIRQLQEQRLQQAQQFEQEKYGFEKQQIEKQQQAQQLLGQSFRDAVGPDGEIDRSKLMSSVMTHNPELWPSVSAEFDKIDQAKLNKQRTQAQIDNLNSEVSKRKNELDAANDEATARLGAIVKHFGDTPEAYQAMRDAEIKSGRVSAERLAPFDAAIAQDPSQIANVTSALMEFGKKKPAGAEGKTREIRTVNPETGKAEIRIVADEPGQTFPVPETGPEAGTVPIVRVNPRSGKVETIGEVPKGAHFVQEPAPAAATGGATGMTKDAVEDMATSYRILGVRGIPTRISGPDRTNVVNEAASQRRALGTSQVQEIQRQAAMQANRSALTRMQTMSSSARAFEDKALNQVDIIKSLSSKVPRTSFPIINSALQAGRTSITGDTNATQLANAIDTFAAEYAKIMSGATGSQAASTDSARAASSRLINTAMSKGTMNDVLDLMSREMRLTIGGYNTVIEDINKNLGGGESPAPATAAPSTTGGKRDPLGIR